MQMLLRFAVSIALAACVCCLPTSVAWSQTDSPEPDSVAAIATAEPATATAAPAASATAKGSGLLDLNLEQLSKVDVLVPSLSMPVTTVTREESTVGRTAAAIFVITPEMIRRSGVRGVPDALRMVPGLEVAYINQNTWAITSRGFNDRFSNKLLVQIDGRVVYSPLFGGVYWDAQDVVLEDVERIEVIRGPGTTVWGSNAVNGVINIITKRAKDTQGVLIKAGGGSLDHEFTTMRYGGQVGDDLHYRFYGKHFDQGPGFSPTGPATDDSRQGRGGFRVDWAPGSDKFTLQGDVYDGASGSTQTQVTPSFPFVAQVPTDDKLRGGNTLFRWNRDLGDDRDSQFQCYYDNTRRNSLLLNEDRETVDLDYQYHFLAAERHDIVTGCGYRRSHDNIQGSYTASFFEPSKLVEWTNAYFQDQIALDPDRWYLTLGTKFEYTTFANLQVQPTARLLFLPSPRASCWGAISRAARSPTRVDTGALTHVLVNRVPPTILQLVGNSSIQAEDLIAYELGYRAQPEKNFSWDLAIFCNDYQNLVGTVNTGPPIFSPPFVILPATFANNISGQTYGAELTSTWQASENWQLFASYTFLQMHLHGPGGVDDPSNGASPQNQLYLRSSWNLSTNVHYDLVGRYVENLPSLGVPSYFVMDMRLAYSPTRHLEVAVVGQNLLDNHHLEFTDVYGGRAATEVPRSVYAMMTWTY